MKQTKIKNGVYIVKGKEILTDNLHDGDGVLLITDYARVIILKDAPSELMTWDEAMEYCEKHNVRLPNKHEIIEITEFKKQISESLRTIGGSPLRGVWHWTSSEYLSDRAWHYSGPFGNLYINYKNISISIRPIIYF